MHGPVCTLQMHVVTVIICEQAAIARKVAHTHAHACAVYTEQTHLNGMYMSCIVCCVNVCLTRPWSTFLILYM